MVGESDEGIPNWEAIVKNNDPVIIDLTRKHTYLFHTEMRKLDKYTNLYTLPTDENPALVGKFLTFDSMDEIHTYYLQGQDPVGYFRFMVTDIDAVYTIEVRTPKNGEVVFSDKFADIKEDPTIDRNNDWGFIKTGSLSGTLVWDRR